jgi:hypothetical protein
MSAFKLVAFIFPFIREMILGEKSLREAVKTNKMRVFVIFLIMLSIFMNFFFLPKLVRVSADYVMLEHQYQTLEQQHPSTPVRKTEHVPAKEKPAPVPPAPERQVELYTPPAQPDTTPPAEEPEPRKRRHNNKPPQHHPVSMGNSPEAVARYQAWKKSFDDIRAHEEYEEYVQPQNADLFKH